MKKQVLFTILVLVLLTSTVWAGDDETTMTMKWGFYEEPSEYKLGEFLKANKAFADSHEGWTAVVWYYHPHGFQVSQQGADSIARTFAMTLRGNGIRVANFYSAYGGQGQNEIQVIWEAPVLTEKATRRIANEEIDKVIWTPNAVGLGGYAVGPLGGRGDFGPAISYSHSDVFGQRVGMTITVGGVGGPSVHPNGDEASEKVMSVNTFFMGQVDILALRVDSDNEAGYFDLSPSVGIFHNGRAMDSDGQFGQVGVGGILGLNFGIGWMKPSRNFSVEGYLEPGFGLGYWWQSDVRPYDVGYANAKFDGSYTLKAGLKLGF